MRGIPSCIQEFCSLRCSITHAVAPFPNVVRGANFQVDVIFLAAEVFVDPFEEAEAAVQKEREEIRIAKAKKDGNLWI